MLCFFLCFLLRISISILLLLSYQTMLTSAGQDDGVWLPVILYNGFQLVIAGHVKIRPTHNFTSFCSNIGQLINVHPDYIISYLVDTSVPGATSPLQYRWKACICQWTDFSLVCQQKDCCFFVVVTPPPQFVDHQNPMLSAGYIQWVQEWQRRNISAMDQSTTAMSNNDVNNAIVESNEGGVQIRKTERCPKKVITQSGVCEDCNGAEAGDDEFEFHQCKLDAIVVNGYGTNFGPIGPRRIEPEIVEVEETGLYSLFGPMPGVDSILEAVRQSVAGMLNK